VLSEITLVSSPTGNNAPGYTFNSTKAGEIAYAGGCSSATNPCSGWYESHHLQPADGWSVPLPARSRCDRCRRESEQTLGVTGFIVDTHAPELTISCRYHSRSNRFRRPMLISERHSHGPRPAPIILSSPATTEFPRWHDHDNVDSDRLARTHNFRNQRVTVADTTPPVIGGMPLPDVTQWQMAGSQPSRSPRLP